MEKASEDLKHYILFQKCKESVEDVVGWKVFIFLPQILAWRFFIVITVVLISILSTFAFLFKFDLKYYDYIELFCNLFYFADTICATMHYLMKNTRALRRGTKRREIYLLLDYFSLLPIHLIGSVLIFNEGYIVSEIFFYSRLNVCLRMYQLYRFFADSKFWISTIKMYFVITCIEILVWFSLCTHGSTCLFYLFLTKEEKEFCHEHPKECIAQLEYFCYCLLFHTIRSENISIRVLDHWYFSSFMLLAGHYLMFGFFFPFLLHAFFKYSSQFVDIAERQVQMELLINNLTENKKIRKKIFKYFQSIWKYGDDKNPPESLKLFPLCYKKNIYCDIHWEAFRHSKMLCDLNLGCKRSLSLKMSTEFITSNTTILKKEDLKTFMIYIESGMLQAMAEENSNSPVLTLSAGTVLGEFSLFHPVKSKVTLRAAKESVIHILNFKNFFVTMLDYPQEMAKLINKLKYRISIGKATYERKMQISLIFSEESASFALGKKKQANIKWIKQQYRGVMELDEVLKKMKSSEDQRFYINRKIQNLDTQLEHTSVNLNLLAINDQVVNKYDLICLKMKFPWSLDPQCSFLTYWNNFILIVVIMTTWTYPIFTGWYKRLPLWFFNITVIVNFIYAIDVLISLMTAIKVRNVIVYNFWKILSHRLMHPHFYCDILASIPLQLMVYFYKERFHYFYIAIITDMVLLKFYKIIDFLNKWNYITQSQITLRTILKNIYFAVIITFWLAIAFMLLEVECIYYECSEEWFKEYEDADESGEAYKIYVAVFTVMFITLNLPFEYYKTAYFFSFCLFFAMTIFICFFIMLIHAECVAASVLQNIHLLHYKNIINFMLHFIQSRKITGRINQRVLDTMTFQWNFDRGEYITQEKSILDQISPKLLDEIIKESVLRSIRMCPMFEEESEELLMDIIRASKHLALPANSLMITFDTQTMCMFLIHKGFVQLTSFLQGDLVNNVGKELILKRGAIFPVVVVLNQEPSVVTARTLTDCELIILELEDILKLMLVHGMFKDVVNSLIATTDFKLLSSGRRGLSKIKDVFKVNYASYVEAFSKYKWFGMFLKLFMRRRAINSNSGWYIQWETSRVICIFLDLILWPFVFGWLCVSKEKIFLINVLLLMDSLAWVDFYIRLHVAYYNSAGVCVTHPSSTCLHYLTTSFLPDFISFLPYIHFLYLVHVGIYDYGFGIYLTHMAMRGFGWYRFFGIMRYLMDTKNFIFRLQFVKFIFTGIILYNIYINGRLLYGLKFNKLFFLYAYHVMSPYIAYLVDISINLLTSFRVWPFFEGFHIYGILHQLFIALMGWLAEVFLFSYVILDAANTNRNFMTYQYHLKNLHTYLNRERVKESVIKKCEEHFEHEWNQKQGEDFKKIFIRFPDSLHEDLLYPLYKTTFNSVLCLAEANEGFYRSLSRLVEEVVFQKGSMVIFSKQVQEYIFFIYKGQCLVPSVNLLLCKGSMIGNLRGQLLMSNTVIAKTHTVLLRISADTFFTTLNNFYSTKKNYEFYILTSSDYFQSVYEDISATVEEILVSTEDKGIAESEFEYVDQSQVKGDKKKKIDKESFHKEDKGVFDPRGRASKIFRFLFLTIAFCSVSLVLIMAGIRSVAVPTFFLLYTFDAIWIFKIIVTLKMAYVDPKTGYLVTKVKPIFMRYLNRYDGFIVDLISVIPLEVIPYIMHQLIPNEDYCTVLFGLCANRLLRFLYFHRFANKVRKRLSTNLANRWGVLLLSKAFMINTCVCVCLILNYLAFEYKDICFSELEYHQFSYYINTTACVINTFVGGGRPDCFPEHYVRLWEETLIALWAFVSKAKLMVEVLHISQVIFFSNSDHIKELERLQNYLMARDVSPALVVRTRNYYTDLLHHYRGSAMPYFLKISPDFVKVNIMEGIYVNHLKNCYLFQDLDASFLQQLAARLDKNVFFPGDYIVEKTDVDYTMYFIHKGEVFCIEKNEEYPALEVPIYLYVKDDHFGLSQGIFKCYPHTNTYRAKTRAEVLLLNFRKWEDMRLAYPEIAAEIFERALRKATDKPFRAKQTTTVDIISD